MTNTLFDSLFAPHAERDKVFLACDNGIDISYRDFVARAAQMAHVLFSCGVRPGDRVVVQAPKLADTLSLYAGCVQAGAVYLPLNTAYTNAERSYFVADAAPKQAFTEDTLESVFEVGFEVSADRDDRIRVSLRDIIDLPPGPSSETRTML